MNCLVDSGKKGNKLGEDIIALPEPRATSGPNNQAKKTSCKANEAREMETESDGATGSDHKSSQSNIPKSKKNTLKRKLNRIKQKERRKLAQGGSLSVKDASTECSTPTETTPSPDSTRGKLRQREGRRGRISSWLLC